MPGVIVEIAARGTRRRAPGSTPRAPAVPAAVRRGSARTPGGGAPGALREPRLRDVALQISPSAPAGYRRAQIAVTAEGA